MFPDKILKEVRRIGGGVRIAIRFIIKAQPLLILQ
jgi:hypothetical protein